MNLRFLLGVALAILFLGCDSATDGPGSTTKSPTSGSTFSYRQVAINSAGEEIPNTEVFFTDSIGDVELSYFGKLRTMQVIRLGDSISPVTYYNIEANGDFSELTEFSHPATTSIWTTFPIHSRVEVRAKFLDTTFLHRGGIREKVTGHVITSYVGNSSLQVGDSTLDCELTKFVVELMSETDTFSDTSYTTVYYSFAPELGFIAERYQYADYPNFLLQGFRQRLIDYSIK